MTNKLPFHALASALGSETRWAILRRLALADEPLMVLQIAEDIGRSAMLTSKHLAVLRKAGVVSTNRAGLYFVPAEYRPAPGRLDFGVASLDFTAPASPPPA